MARRPRSHLPDGVYHVTARAPGGTRLFVDDQDRRVFVALLDGTLAKHDLVCWAYCVMGTHYHLVLQGRRDVLSGAMHRLNGRYAHHFNERHERRGHVFADRYSAYVIGDEAHLEEACRYVAANPVRAGLCQSIDQWPWSWLAGTIPSAA